MLYKCIKLSISVYLGRLGEFNRRQANMVAHTFVSKTTLLVSLTIYLYKHPFLRGEIKYSYIIKINLIKRYKKVDFIFTPINKLVDFIHSEVLVSWSLAKN